MSGDHNQYQKAIKLQDENESPPEKWAQFGQVNGLRPEPTIDGWPLYSGLPSQTKGEHMKDYEDYDTQRLILIEYMQVMIARRDWHGVSDVANDLRVLEAEEKNA